MKTKYKINYSVIRIGILLFLLPVASFSLFGQSANQNYIRTRTMTNENGSKYLDVIQYYDGLGRPVETVQKGITPTGKDLISYQGYDAFGRPDSSWLPVVSASSYGNFVALPSFKTLSSSTYNNTSLNLVSDDKPYSRTVYEASPLDRILQEFGPGKDWHNNNKPVKTEYLTNTSSLTIPYFTCSDTRDNVTVTRSNYYPVNQLYIVLKTDEDGNEYLEAKNKLGQLVCTRQKAESIYFYTSYVYDSFGNLKVVLPPEAVSQHTSGPLSETNQLFKDYVFAYKYDSRNRCIGKKIPGADWVQYIYDKADQLIFTRKGTEKWFFSIPDVFGREVMTGECTGMFFGNSTTSQVISPGCLDNVVVQAVPQNGSPRLDGYYTVTAVRPANAIFYAVYYYDNYRFLTDTNVTDFQRPEYRPEMNISGYDKPDTVSVKGLLTGKKVLMVQEDLNPTDINSYYYTALYYDRKARLVQSRNRHHLSGYDIEYYSYNFLGQVTGKKAVNSVKPNTTTITTTEIYTYQYDLAGRLESTQLSINGGATKVLALNAYDELGRLKTSMPNGQNNLKTNYSYNIRSWVQGVSSFFFTEGMEYNKNGNILSMQWTQPDKSLRVARKYTFTYDGLSRLKSASFTGGANGENAETAYSYDKNGNITSLKRKDAKIASSTSGYLDDLTFVYSNNNHSNQVVKITDTASASRQAQSMDFKDYANTAAEYAYNANGAMTKDLNRGISSIVYNNQLNLPVRMEILSPVAEARVRYTYLATGEKVKVEHRWNVNYSTSPIIGNSPVSDTRLKGTRSLEYIGNKVFEDGILKKILYENGYYEGGQYYFYIQDHLGNNRLTADQGGNVKQSVHYFPFGATMYSTGIEDSFQEYKYNGKELERMHGLNQYDYHARGYDPVIGRFTTIDPLAEKYYSISPYVYCMNNPIKYIDPDGRDIRISYFVKYNRSGQEVFESWTFNGTNQNQAPSNQFVQDFLTAYNYNIGNGGGESMYKLANSENMTVNLRDGIDNSHKKGWVFWNPRWASKTAEGYTYSPATILEHEMDHALGYLTDADAHKARVEADDKQYDTKEERRVITGAEAKTAQANGEFPKGYVRSDHAAHGSVHVNDPTKTTPMSTGTPQQKQIPAPTLWERFLQWWNN